MRMVVGFDRPLSTLRAVALLLIAAPMFAGIGCSGVRRVTLPDITVNRQTLTEVVLESNAKDRDVFLFYRTDSKSCDNIHNEVHKVWTDTLMTIANRRNAVRAVVWPEPPLERSRDYTFVRKDGKWIAQFDACPGS